MFFMIRFGLCCLFKKAEIKFRTARVSYVKKLDDPLAYFDEIIWNNVCSLKKAIQYCIQHGIGCFRVTSRFFPLYTHPEQGYVLQDLVSYDKILAGFAECRALAQKNDLRLTLHPDQFVVLNSPREEVVNSAIRELEYHNILADYIGADVINIHLGGAYDDKSKSLQRFITNYLKLSSSVQQKLTIENDDKIYSPSDALIVAQKLTIPFVYDVHHHRCLPDELSEETAIQEALKTWQREPLFHLSSPLSSRQQRSHADYIDVADFPSCWKKIKETITVEIEAKAKELAVEQLMQQLQ